MREEPRTQNVGDQTSAYALNSLYDNPIPPLDWQQGASPQDTLPADWWNWLWKNITKEELATVKDLQDVFAEVISVITDSRVFPPINPDESDHNQLVAAIESLIRYIGRADLSIAIEQLLGYDRVQQEGSVSKAALDPEYPDRGILYVPCIGNLQQLSTTVKTTLVGAINELFSYVGQYSQNVPIGACIPYAGNGGDPDFSANFLFCDGANYKAADYPLLWSVIGTTYGYNPDDPDDNFNVPDLRQGVIYGVDSNDNDFLLGSKIQPQDSNHKHQYSLFAANTGSAARAGTGGGGAVSVLTSGGYVTSDTTSPSTPNSSKGPLVKGVALNYIMRAR